MTVKPKVQELIDMGQRLADALERYVSVLPEVLDSFAASLVRSYADQRVAAADTPADRSDIEGAVESAEEVWGARRVCVVHMAAYCCNNHCLDVEGSDESKCALEWVIS